MTDYDQSLLATKELVTGYGRVVVVDSVSICVRKGEIVSVLGPNGSGKSTLVKGIIGILPVFGGQVLFKQHDITHMRLDKVIKMGIGYVPQINNVFTDLTVDENLEIGYYLRKKDRTLMADLNEIFETFPEIRPFRKRKAGTLSGGERQMLAIARAMMSRPELLILDEPTANLAPKSVSMLHSKIQEINERGVSILMVEQNAQKALEISDRAYVMAAGRCIWEGAKDQGLKEVNLARLFLGLYK